MNFFGHAVVARLASDRPGFVLGAMLPDFATMIAARPPDASHEALRSGIEFHHRTDDVFHRCEGFRDLQREAFDALTSRGVGRGGARAVAHIGIELLIDAELALDSGSRTAYVDALGHGHPEELGRYIEWSNPNDQQRYTVLRDRLEEYGVHPGVDADALAVRLERILSRRPRLAIDARERDLVRDWIVESAPEVANRSEALMKQVRGGLKLGD